jgi:hypothetical protein
MNRQFIRHYVEMVVAMLLRRDEYAHGLVRRVRARSSPAV